MSVYVVTGRNHDINETTVQVFSREIDAKEYEKYLWLMVNKNGSEVYSNVEIHKRLVL